MRLLPRERQQPGGGAPPACNGPGESRAGAVQPSPDSGRGAPQGVELRHLRYFVAVADAGTFTHAAERMFVAQPTLSQRSEEHTSELQSHVNLVCRLLLE